MATTPWVLGNHGQHNPNPRVPAVHREAYRRAMMRDIRIPFRGDYQEDRLFLDFDRPSNDVGWKLHVVKPPTLSVDTPELPDCYRRLLSYLYDKDIPHKIVRSLAHLSEMERNPLQVGKFITIYPENSGQLKELSDRIEAKFPDNPAMNRTMASGDLPAGSRGIVSARWGGLTGPFTVDRDNNLINDDRSRPYPAWVKNPFDPESRGNDGWIKFEDHPQIKDQLASRMGERGGISLDVSLQSAD